MSDREDNPAESNRDRIVDLAIRFLGRLPNVAERGGDEPLPSPDALTIRKAAELLSEADGKRWSTSVPLFEFPERASLVAAVAAEGFRRLNEWLAGAGGSTGGGRLELLCRRYVDWAVRHPLLFRAMYDPQLAPGVALVHREQDAERRKAGLAALYRSQRAGDDDAGDDAPDAAAKRRRIVRNRQDRKRLESFQELLEAKEQAVMAFEWAAGEGTADGSIGRGRAALVAHAVTALADGLAWQLINEPQGTPDALMQHARQVIGLTIGALRQVSEVERVAARSSERAGWPVRVMKVSEQPAEDLRATTTVAERLAMVEELTGRTWPLTGIPAPDYSREATPVRVRRP